MDNDIGLPEGNPLEPSDDRDARIRERAYHLWESEGRIEGRDADYWERARELDAMENGQESGLLPIDAPQRVDEAELEENLGEFPDRLADQGERQATPMARGRSAKG